MNNQVSFIPIGGIGDVTKNMYLYEYQDQILIVDCGLGFADQTMIGVDLLLPDITYLLKTNKKIVGMVLTHGHEDHIGGLPFIIPQLPSFPIYATALTAAFANNKLKEFGVGARVQTVSFTGGDIKLGNFSVSFSRITHSVPDTSNVFIKTPAGNFYHASDYKFDLTPFDEKRVEFEKIAEAAKTGVLCLMSDCLGAEREGYTPSERQLAENIEAEMRKCEGKFFLTTYSSNISRLNQAIVAAQKVGRKVCFLGRSLVKAVEIAESLGYLKLDKGREVQVHDLKKYQDKDLCLLVAGSQGQENSALTRMANNDHRDVKIGPKDVVVFSADPIPGNEVNINAVIDTIARKGARVVYSEISDNFHVSGHGASQEILLMMSLTKPQMVLPIGGTFKQMVAYKNLAKSIGFKNENILLIDDGQEVKFTKNGASLGNKVSSRNVYVDEFSGEEVEQFVLRDRQKISKEGVVVILLEIDSQTGQIVEKANIIARGIPSNDIKILNKNLLDEIKRFLTSRKGKVTNWAYVRNNIRNISERYISKTFRKQPMILPIVIEV